MKNPLRQNFSTTRARKDIGTGRLHISVLSLSTHSFGGTPPHMHFFMSTFSSFQRLLKLTETEMNVDCTVHKEV